MRLLTSNFSAHRMPARRFAGTQRGFLLVTAVVLIVIAALLISVMVFLSATNTESGASNTQSAQALFIAESGMERALHGFTKEGAACGSLTYTAGIGQGNFATTGTLYAPSATTLSAAISATDIVIPVASVAGYARHGRIIIGSESINYTGSSSSSCGAFSPPCLTGAARGVSGSIAAAHVFGATVSQNQCLIRSVGTVGNASRTVDRAVSAVSGSTGAIMVYAKETPAASVGIPFYRIWDNAGATWGVEQQATDVGANPIEYIIVKSARTRNETILGTLDSNGDIRVQIWNGSTWSDGTTVGATRLLANIGTTNDAYRGFDIEYETGGDRALVVYNNANNRNPSYQIWNGTSWSAAVSLSAAAELNGSYTNNAVPPVWFELAADPRTGVSNMVLFTLDTSRGVYGVYWNGSKWSRMSASTALWGTPSSFTYKPMDVAYEQNLGRAMFIWGTGNSASNQQQYRTWDITTLTLSGITNQSISNTIMFNVAQWCRLAAQPNSNNLMYVVQDAGRDLNSLTWNGSAFGSETNHDANTEAAQSRNYDFVFETYPANAGQGWLVWGTATGSDQLRRKRWNVSGWDAALAKIGDDTAYVRLLAHPVTGAVFTGIYQSSGSAPTNRDIQEIHLTNGSVTWSALAQVWDGGVVANPVMQRVAIAPVGGSLSLYDWVEIFP